MRRIEEPSKYSPKSTYYVLLTEPGEPLEPAWVQGQRALSCQLVCPEFPNEGTTVANEQTHVRARQEYNTNHGLEWRWRSPAGSNLGPSTPYRFGPQPDTHR
jgi:hypothetical protein